MLLRCVGKPSVEGMPFDLAASIMEAAERELAGALASSYANAMNPGYHAYCATRNASPAPGPDLGCGTAPPLSARRPPRFRPGFSAG